MTLVDSVNNPVGSQQEHQLIAGAQNEAKKQRNGVKRQSSALQGLSCPCQKTVAPVEDCEYGRKASPMDRWGTLCSHFSSCIGLCLPVDKERKSERKVPSQATTATIQIVYLSLNAIH